MAEEVTSGLGLTQPEAAHNLGRSVQTVQRLIAAGHLRPAVRRRHGQLDREQVEQLAARHWRPHGSGLGRTPWHETSYWVSTSQVAQLLGVGRTRVGQVVDRGFLPCMRTPDGHRIFRRAQVQVIANSRRLRRQSLNKTDDTPVNLERTPRPAPSRHWRRYDAYLGENVASEARRCARGWEASNHHSRKRTGAQRTRFVKACIRCNLGVGAKRSDTPETSRG